MMAKWASATERDLRRREMKVQRRREKVVIRTEETNSVISSPDQVITAARDGVNVAVGLVYEDLHRHMLMRNAVTSEKGAD